MDSGKDIRERIRRAKVSIDEIEITLATPEQKKYRETFSNCPSSRKR